MKKIMSSLLPASALLSVFSLYAFAESGEKVGVLKTLGNNIWYILLVIVFGAGLILVSKWSGKIKENDQKLSEEAEKFKKENSREDEEKTDTADVKTSDEENSVHVNSTDNTDV